MEGDNLLFRLICLMWRISGQSTLSELLCYFVAPLPPPHVTHIALELLQSDAYWPKL
eukprot:COSAG05_NODE_10_length_39559_cov_64.255423_13_plen_57_part_00